MRAAVLPEFEHVFVPGVGAGTTVLLLHGTGGNEHDLIPLGKQLLPSAAFLSPRGQVLEHGMPRFFHRHAEGVFDVADLQARADALARWTEARVAEYQAPPRIIAVGFSNGANIAAAVMLQAPALLAGAVLFRAMVPYAPEARPALAGVSALMCEGLRDPIIPRANAERLAEILRESGAAVTLEWMDASHGLTQADIDTARRFVEVAWP